MTEGWSGFLGLLDFFAHIGRERWCIRRPCRALVATIIPWSTARAGTVGGMARTGIGLHALHSRLVRTSLGCRAGCRPRGNGRPHVSWGALQTASQTEFGHFPIQSENDATTHQFNKF